MAADVSAPVGYHNSYQTQLAPNTTHTQDNCYPRRLITKTTREQDSAYQNDSHPDKPVPKSYTRQLFWLIRWFTCGFGDWLINLLQHHYGTRMNGFYWNFQGISEMTQEKIWEHLGYLPHRHLDAGVMFPFTPSTRLPVCPSVCPWHKYNLCGDDVSRTTSGQYVNGEDHTCRLTICSQCGVS